jgi:ubiquinone/menaquinone biosynthesis C-methylase UbiE
MIQHFSNSSLTFFLVQVLFILTRSQLEDTMGFNHIIAVTARRFAVCGLLIVLSGTSLNGKQSGDGAQKPVAGNGPAAEFREPGDFYLWYHRAMSASFHRPFYKKFAERVNLRGDEHVMDFGAGQGAVDVHLVKKLSVFGGRITLLDLSKKSLDQARKRMKKYTNVEYLAGDITAMNLPEKTYDVVIIHFVLHDIPAETRPAILKSIAAVLKPGGRIFIREPLKKKHGMPVEEIRRLMNDASLQEELYEFQKRTVMGKLYFGVYIKQ